MIFQHSGHFSCSFCSTMLNISSFSWFKFCPFSKIFNFSFSLVCDLKCGCRCGGSFLFFGLFCIFKNRVDVTFFQLAAGVNASVHLAWLTGCITAAPTLFPHNRTTITALKSKWTRTGTASSHKCQRCRSIIKEEEEYGIKRCSDSSRGRVLFLLLFFS